MMIDYAVELRYLERCLEMAWAVTTSQLQSGIAPLSGESIPGRLADTFFGILI
jgi:hypothetical protein